MPDPNERIDKLIECVRLMLSDHWVDLSPTRKRGSAMLDSISGVAGETCVHSLSQECGHYNTAIVRENNGNRWWYCSDCGLMGRETIKSNGPVGENIEWWPTDHAKLSWEVLEWLLTIRQCDGGKWIPVGAVEKKLAELRQ